MMKKNGFTLGYILAITAVGLIYLFFVSTNSINSLYLSARYNRVITAILSAQSGINRTIFALETNDVAIPLGCNKVTTYITNQLLVNGSIINLVKVISNYDPNVTCISSLTFDNITIPINQIYITATAQKGNTFQTVHQLLLATLGTGKNGKGNQGVGNGNTSTGNQGSNGKSVGQACGNGPNCIQFTYQKWWRN